MSPIENAAPAASQSPERVDPELLALPAPPRGRRLGSLVVMAFAVAFSLAFIASLRADIEYFFAPSQATDLGDVTSLDPATLVPNTFVHVRGTPMASGMVRYSRMIGGQSYTVYPLAGQEQRAVFVQVPSAGARADRTTARLEFSGRLVTFGQLGGRFGAIRSYLSETMGMAVSSESFLLLEGDAPASYSWSLALAGLAVLFILANIALLVRWFRPIPVPDVDDDPSLQA